ncbi:hypothetical protein KC19_VG017900 [Ceratodon purpureus]|uniref:Uncharacterized protein n=1 Tax=Ceratodon purpureus TaxID=3225 RepID=A0A8T0HL23_CERPU|nr:hypothetical protein KC19_VG017900 [Ceratodon purpureus]
MTVIRRNEYSDYLCKSTVTSENGKIDRSGLCHTKFTLKTTYRLSSVMNNQSEAKTTEGRYTSQNYFSYPYSSPQTDLRNW